MTDKYEALGVEWLGLYCYIPTVLLLVFHCITIAQIRKQGANGGVDPGRRIEDRRFDQMEIQTISYNRMESEQTNADDDNTIDATWLVRLVTSKTGLTRE